MAAMSAAILLVYGARVRRQAVGMTASEVIR
jgi:hypothetical protein